MRTSVTMLAVSLLAFSCQRNDAPVLPTGGQITYSTSLLGEDAVQAARLTKVDPVQPTATATLTSMNGESFSTYVTKYSAGSSQPIDVNVYTNVKFDVSAAGVVTPAQSLYYPTKVDKITTYAFRPYSSTNLTKSTAAAYSFSVASNQSTAAAVKGSDFLFAKADGDPAASSTAVKLTFAHAYTLLQVKITVPKLFADHAVESLSDAVIKGLKTASTINLNSLTVAASGSAANITPYAFTVTSVDAKSDLYVFEAVVVPQTVATSTELFSVTANLKDVAAKPFKYVTTAALNLQGGYYHTLNLQVNDYGKLELKSATIGDWDNSVIVGDLGGAGVNNGFEFQLVNYTDINSTLIKSIKVYIDNVAYTFSGAKMAVAQSGLTTKVTVTLPDDNGKSPKAYPYIVTSAELCNAASVVLKKQFFSTEIAGGGTITIPWFNYSSITNDGTTAGGWGSASSTSDEQVEVNNDFTFMLCNKSATAALACNTANKVKLTFLDNSSKEFSIVMTGNTFAAITSAVSNFTGTSSVTKYPYTINKVEFFKDATSLASGTASFVVKNDRGFSIYVSK